ncbi:MAG: hypothetical protein ACLGIA_02325 [Actinomycetes bacterium]
MTDHAVTLDDVAAELYAVPPEQFTARRDDLARATRTGGDRELAKAVKALRRPTVAAWVVNTAVRERLLELDDLLDLGAQLRQAQSELDGPRIRDLSRARQQLEADVLGRLRERASAEGREVSAAAWGEVEQTLHAATADTEAADAVRSGRLTRSLSYAGFGSVDVSNATATPLRARPDECAPVPTRRDERRPERRTTTGHEPGSRTPSTARQDDEDRRRRERDERALQLRELQSAVDDAQAAVGDAERRRDQTARAEEGAEARVDDLYERLQDAREQLAEATKEAESAERELGRAERSLAAVRRRLAREQERTARGQS